MRAGKKLSALSIIGGDNKMTRGTTPTYIIKMDDSVDCSTITKVYVSFYQQQANYNDHLLTKSDGVINPANHTVSVTLSQEDTLGFNEGTIQIQVRGAFSNDVVFASSIVTDTVYNVLYEEVITNE